MNKQLIRKVLSILYWILIFPLMVVYMLKTLFGYPLPWSGPVVFSAFVFVLLVRQVGQKWDFL
jgi:hypothetical protein